MLRLISVPHTGTVYTRALLARMGLEDGVDYASHHTDDLGYPLSYVSGSRVVVPVRDPMLAEISRINRGSGLPVSEWAKLADWRNLENVHWLHVPAYLDDVYCLAEFVGAEPVPVDVTPLNSRPDPNGLKDEYAEGRVPAELAPAFRWLSSREDVKALFRGLGYDLLWMR